MTNMNGNGVSYEYHIAWDVLHLGLEHMPDEEFSRSWCRLGSPIGISQIDVTLHPPRVMATLKEIESWRPSRRSTRGGVWLCTNFGVTTSERRNHD